MPRVCLREVRARKLRKGEGERAGEGRGEWRGGRNGERSTEERSICSGMHSALIALSASRIYTLLRAEPLKKPSFTLPLHETSPVPSRATSPIVKSRNFEARCALPVAKMDDPPDTRYRRETFSDSRRWVRRRKGFPSFFHTYCDAFERIESNRRLLDVPRLFQMWSFLI